jgi:hypothetical protein
VDCKVQVGDRVDCKVGTGLWSEGIVVKLFYTQSSFPSNQCVPYEIELEDGHRIFAPCDNNNVIRRVRMGARAKAERVQRSCWLQCASLAGMSGREAWRLSKSELWLPDARQDREDQLGPGHPACAPTGCGAAVVGVQGVGRSAPAALPPGRARRHLVGRAAQAQAASARPDRLSDVPALASFRDK